MLHEICSLWIYHACTYFCTSFYSSQLYIILVKTSRNSTTKVRRISGDACSCRELTEESASWWSLVGWNHRRISVTVRWLCTSLRTARRPASSFCFVQSGNANVAQDRHRVSSLVDTGQTDSTSRLNGRTGGVWTENWRSTGGIKHKTVLRL